MAERRHRRRQRDDRNLRQGTRATPRPGRSKRSPSTTLAQFLCHFKNGSLGLFESTRYARGHKALYTLEINGENASIRWDLHDLHRLEFFDYKDESKLRGWRSIHVTDHSGEHPYMKNWWVPGLQIGYEHTFVHQVADFLKALGEGKPCARPSATPWKPKKSATRSWPARRIGSGTRWSEPQQWVARQGPPCRVAQRPEAQKKRAETQEIDCLRFGPCSVASYRFATRVK
ncbi:MAG: hypothetical protein QM811_07915 [Pirellulales bacterium]